MTLTVSQTIIGGMLTGLRDALDAGPAAGRLRLYTGPRPAGGAAITTETVLADLQLDEPSGAPVGNELRLTSSATTLCLNDGLAIWGRFVDGYGNYAIDGLVGLAGATAFDPATVYAPGAFASVGSSVFACVATTTAAAPFDPAQWLLCDLLLDSVNLLAGGKVVLTQAVLRLG